MPSEKAIDFYRSIRSQPDLWAEMSSAESTDDLVTRLTAASAKSGHDLTDDELELVAAGSGSDPGYSPFKGMY